MVLDGVVVLDITQAGAGAFATRLLADLGALVLKIELPPAGDLSRIMFATQTGDGILFENNNAGKRGLCFDYRQPAGKELLVELLAKSDVFIENFSAGTVARYGLDYPTIVGIRPDVVMCSVSTFGQTGPWRQHVGAEPSAQALAGMAYMNREPGERPILVSSAIADSATAVHAALAVVAALYRRTLTGEGDYVELSQVDTMMSMDLLNVPRAAARASGVPFVGDDAIEPTGVHQPVTTPFGTFRAADGFVTIETWGAGPGSHWSRLCQALVRPDLVDDDRFRTDADRWAHLNELVLIIESWLRTRPRAESVEILLRHRVIAAPVLSPAEAVASDIAAARNVVREVAHPRMGSIKMIASPAKFQRAGETLLSRAPLLGEHTAWVLREILGYDEGRIASLITSGVLGRPDPAVSFGGDAR